MALFNPFCKCLNPQRIVNPYTHECVTVPCGKCQACILAKNSRYAFQCDLESYSSMYTVFVTLTYAPNYLPIATPVSHPVDSSDFFSGVLSSYSLVDFDTGEDLGEFEMPVDKLELLQQKFNLCGSIPYLRKTDLQLFLKRFRYYVTKRFPKEKVRYYAVGEYGPVHFRPHYHLLLFLNSKEALQICSEAVSKAWTFGRVDCQVSEGKCSSYVAGYVNSSVLIPEVLKMRSVCPFCLHSQRLGQGFLQGERKKVYSFTPRDFIKRSLVVNGKYKEFDIWRSAYSYFYPKCRGYADKSSYERSYSYRVYDTARYLFPSAETTFSLAKEVATFVYLFHTTPYVLRVASGDILYNERKYDELCRYFYDSEVVTYPLHSIEFDRYVHRVYGEFLLSKHFLYFVCDRPSLLEQKRKLKLIEEFYSQLDYMRLTDFFEAQKLFYENEDFYGDADLMSDEWENNIYPYFYDNFRTDMELYKKTPVYSQYSAQVSKLFNDRIKHKKLNDLNRIFIDENK